MGKITVELLRKRSEHNEGVLSTLEEITLHQFHLDSIDPILAKMCKKLRILYLQDNVIPKIGTYDMLSRKPTSTENLHKLKCLEYLNMAVNNVEKIEGLQACESLKKLDLTANFIADITTVQSLKANYNLQQLCAISIRNQSNVIGTLQATPVQNYHGTVCMLLLCYHS